MHKPEMLLTHTHPKMSQGVDLKGFGNFFILGTEKVSWIYYPSIIHYDGYITHFFLYLLKWEEHICRVYYRKSKFWGCIGKGLDYSICLMSCLRVQAVKTVSPNSGCKGNTVIKNEPFFLTSKFQYPVQQHRFLKLINKMKLLFVLIN